MAEAVQQDLKLQLAKSAIQGSTTILGAMSISLYLIFSQRPQEQLIGMETILWKKLMEKLGRKRARI